MSQYLKKAKRYIRKKKDGHELMEAPYEIKDYGPFDNNLQGAPIPEWFIASLILVAISMGAWIYYFWISDPRQLGVELATLGYWAGWAVLVVFGMLCGLVGIHLWEGIAGEYKWFLDLDLWDIDLKEPICAEWRVENYWPLWNPKTRQGAWRNSEEHKEILEEEELETRKKELRAEIEELKEQKKQEQIDDMAEAIDERMKKAGKRFTSAREIIRAARVASSAVKEAEELDTVKDTMDLRKRLIEIIEAIDLDYYITLLECEGDIYPLVISDYPLFSGDIESGHSEFSAHRKKVRSWMYWASREVNNACVGAGIRFDDYTYLKIPDEEEMLIDKKAGEKKWGPIIYITQSDGKVQDVLDMHKQTPHIPTQNDVLQTELVYDASMADTVLKRMKLLTSHVESKNKSEEEIKREYEAWKKKEVANALKLIRQTGTTGEEGWTDKIRHTSWGQAIRYLTILGLAALALIGAMFVMDRIGWLNVDTIFPPGNGTAPEDDWTVGSLVLSWLKLKLGGIP
jgi:hypothetical protein